MATFDKIAPSYRQTSLVQASAGQQLMHLLDIPDNADILDIGCGTGNLTASLAEITTGHVTGIDPSENMISEASGAIMDPRIRFFVNNAEEIDFWEQFDIVYCNSAFQWFIDPARCLGNFRKALRPGGKIGMQAPARHDYCPAFIEAISECCSDPEIRQVFDGFRSPWFLPDSAETYRNLFERAGFRVLLCRIEASHSLRTPSEAFDIFNSGAKAGYLNPAYYDRPWPAGYETSLLEGIRNSFMSMAGADGRFDLMFYRIFTIAENPATIDS